VKSLFSIVLVMSMMSLMTGCQREAANPIDKEAAARGKQLISKCTMCHSVNDDKAFVGPSLKGVIGRNAGTVAGYEYSPAMVKSGLVWTPENIETFLKNPSALVPGTKMAIGEVPPNEAKDIIEYLRLID